MIECDFCQDGDCCGKIEQLKEQLSLAIEALEQLADPEAYLPPEPSDPETGYFEPHGKALHEIAAEALAKLAPLSGRSHD